MITASPTAPVGSVTHVASWHASDIPHTSAILCRNTAPLVSVAFLLLRNHVPCHILGRDIASGLTKQIAKFRASSLSEFHSRLDTWEAREIKRFETKRKYASADAVSDRATCLRIFADGATSVSDITSRIEQLFAAGPGVTLATIHRAKGLEWPDVYFLDRHLIPSRHATKPWELTQERNLTYVAITRAKLNLTYIRSDNHEN